MKPRITNDSCQSYVDISRCTVVYECTSDVRAPHGTALSMIEHHLQVHMYSQAGKTLNN